MNDYENLLPDIVAVSHDAGEAIMRVYATDFDVARKADDSPVTEADLAAEALITPVLEALTPDIPIVAEEAASRGEMPNVGDGPFWLVDSLDGTREFIGRNGEFTVNIALIEEGWPTLGVVHIPAKGLSCWASGPGRAHCRDAGGTRAIAVREPDNEGYVVVASRSHRDARTDEWLESIAVKSFTAAGSSLKFCLVAMGEADLYPRLGRTMEWDTAAGHAVLRAAGGSVRTLAGGVRTLEGEDLRYGKPGFENPFFVARGDPARARRAPTRPRGGRQTAS